MDVRPLCRYDSSMVLGRMGGVGVFPVTPFYIVRLMITNNFNNQNPANPKTKVLYFAGDHCYCQICKRGNDVGIEKARRLKEVERQREALVTKEKIRKIVEENERLRKENEEKNLIIEKQEEEILKRALGKAL